jgi:uncharacterized protein (UPF0335 family)
MDPAEVKTFVSEIEALSAKKLQLHMAYMNECRSINDDVSALYSAAKEAGIPKTALRKVIKTRALQKALDAIREDLAPEDQDRYDLIRHALGDLADLLLGEAALATKKPTKKRRSDAADSLAH